SIGFALTLQDAEPAFHIRANKEVATATAVRPLSKGWHHLAAVLDTDRAMRLYVDGDLAGSATAPALLPRKPAMPLVLGADPAGTAGDSLKNVAYAGLLDEVAIYYRALSTEEIQARAQVADAHSASNAVLACSFNQKDAKDESGSGMDGSLRGVKFAPGKN